MWTTKRTSHAVGLALTAPAPVAKPDAAIHVTFYSGVPMYGPMRYDGDEPPQVTVPPTTTFRQVVMIGMERGVIRPEHVLTLSREKGDPVQRRVQREWVGPRIPLDAPIGAYRDFLLGPLLSVGASRPGHGGRTVLSIGFWLRWDYSYELPSNLLNADPSSAEPFGTDPVFRDPLSSLPLREAVFLQTPRGFIVTDREAAAEILRGRHPTTGEAFTAAWAAAARSAVQAPPGEAPLYLRLDPPPAPWRGATNAAPMHWPTE